MLFYTVFPIYKIFFPVYKTFLKEKNLITWPMVRMRSFFLFPCYISRKSDDPFLNSPHHITTFLNKPSRYLYFRRCWLLRPWEKPHYLGGYCTSYMVPTCETSLGNSPRRLELKRVMLLNIPWASLLRAIWPLPCPEMHMCVCVCVCACTLSCFSRVWLFVTLRTVPLQAPLSMGFSRQEYCSGLPHHLQRIFLTQWLNPHLLCLLHWGEFFTASATGKAHTYHISDALPMNQ